MPYTSLSVIRAPLFRARDPVSVSCNEKLSNECDSFIADGMTPGGKKPSKRGRRRTKNKLLTKERLHDEKC